MWQTARTLTKGVYQATRTQPLKDDWPLRDQMKRAAISIGSNIAEGYERGTRKQHIEACYLAKGSVGELRSQIIMADDAGLLSEPACSWLMKTCELCARQLGRYIRHLKSTQTRIPGSKFSAPSARGAGVQADSNETGVRSSPSHLPTLPPSHNSPGAVHGPV